MLRPLAFRQLWHCRDLMPNRLRRAVLKHIAYGEAMRIEETLSAYAQAPRIMRHRIQEAAAR